MKQNIQFLKEAAEHECPKDCAPEMDIREKLPLKWAVCRIALYLLLFLDASVIMCQQPSWTTTKQNIRYPEQLYILGVGAAAVRDNRVEAMQRSGDEAFADIAKQLRANISDVSATSTIEISSDKGSGIAQKTEANLRVSTDLKLAGLRIVDTYFDDDNKIFYSLAVLDRHVVASQLRDKMKPEEEDYDGCLAEVDKSIAAGSVVPALSVFAKGYQAAAVYNSLAPVYNYIVSTLIVDDSTLMLPRDLSVTALDQEAQSIINALSIDKVSGESQEVKLLQPLEPLVCRVLYAPRGGKSHPVTGIRVKFDFVNGSGKISESSATDETGTAKCQIYSLAPYSSTYYTVRARIDLSAFKSAAAAERNEWNSRIDAVDIQTVFSLVKTKLSLDDKLRQMIASLSESIPGSGESVCVSRIDFQGKIPGELSEYLRQHVESSVKQNSNMHLMSAPAVSESLGVNQGGSRGTAQGTSYRSFAAQSGIKFVLSGSYWQRGESVELNLNATEANTGAIAATASTTLEKNMLPDVPLAPANYKPEEDDKIIEEKSSGGDLDVNVWVNKANGVYHNGDTLAIYLSSNKDAYVQLVYVDAAGRSLVLFPNTYDWDNKILAGKVYRVPDVNSPIMLTIQPPFGREILKVFASETPIPKPNGPIYNGLVVIESMSAFQTNTRGIGLVSKGYREGSIVISTFP